MRLAGQRFLNFVRFPGKRPAEYFGAVFRHQQHVFNTDADAFLGYVDAWFDGNHHPGFERSAGGGWIMHVDADLMSQTVDEILAERLPVQILAVGVDVIERYLAKPDFIPL